VKNRSGRHCLLQKYKGGMTSLDGMPSRKGIPENNSEMLEPCAVGDVLHGGDRKRSSGRRRLRLRTRATRFRTKKGSGKGQ